MSGAAEARRETLYIRWGAAAMVWLVAALAGVVFADWLMWVGVAGYTVAVVAMLWVAVSAKFVRREP